MKKVLIFFIITMTSLLASADNYITVGVNDTLRVLPSSLGHCLDVPFRAHFDGRLNYWHLTMCFDSIPGMVPEGVLEQSGMDVPYFDATGTACIHHATLTAISNYQYIYSYISVTGYWDYNGDGIYEPYGKVKWEAGDYDCLFYITFRVNSDFIGGFFTIDGELISEDDVRGGCVGHVYFFKTIQVIVGYPRGDVNGNGSVTMDDLTALINYLTYNTYLDEYQLEAADMNGNGIVNMDDLTALINYLVYNQGMSLNELEEVLNGGTQMS